MDNLLRLLAQRLFVRVASSGSFSEAALQGQGIVLFPTWLLFDALRDGGLTTILETYEALGEATREGIHVIYPENRLRSQKVAVFVSIRSRQLASSHTGTTINSDVESALIHF